MGDWNLQPEELSMADALDMVDETVCSVEEVTCAGGKEPTH